MIERFLFDRVDTEAGGAAVGGEYHLPVEVPADEAGTALAFMQVAIARAQIALDA